jgi:hypothetical protein
MDENVAGKRRRRLWIAGSKEYAEKSSMLLQCYFDCFSAKQGKINPLEKKVGSDYEMQTAGAEMMWIGKGDSFTGLNARTGFRNYAKGGGSRNGKSSQG